MLKYIKPVKYYYMIFVIFELIASIASAYAIINMNDMLQNALSGNIDEVYKNIVFIISFFLISTILSVFASFVVLKRALRAQNTKLRAQIANKINLLNDQEYSLFKKGELLSWFTNDAQTIESDCFQQVFNFSSAVITLVVYAASFYKIGWLIGIITFAIAIMNVAVPYLFVASISKQKTKVSEQQSAFTSKMVDLLGGYREFAYKNNKKTYTKFVNEEVVKLETSKFKLDKKNTYKSSTAEFVSLVGQILVVISAIILYLLGYIGVGAILAAGAMIFTIIHNSKVLVESLTTIKASKNILNKYNVGEFEKYEPNEIAFKLLELKGLKYEIGEETIFNNFNLNIQRNKKYLLVGPSGSGKSTLFKIIFGLINEYQGDLVINKNLNYHQIDKRDLWNIIAYVPQENIIFNASLRDNLTLWNNEITDDQIIQALKKVNLMYLLENISLDTFLNNDSKNLSGGELQRVAIARALLQNKSIMILDEITSSLDKTNRLMIEDLVASLDKTILYISHTTNAENNNFDETIRLHKK